MASNSAAAVKDESKTPKGDPEAEKLAALISGLEDVSEPDIAGWFKPVEGAEFAGNAVKVIQIDDDDDQPRDVLLVKLRAPCSAAVMEESPITVAAGEILAVGMRFGLQELLSYVEKQALVYAKATGKQKLKGGRSKWNWVIRADKKKRTAPVAPVARVSGGDSDGGF
jgi:hypothetical protein